MTTDKRTDEETVSESLCHYTSLNGFMGIVQNSNIWATNSSFLNDSTELLYGMSCLEEPFKHPEGVSYPPKWSEHLATAVEHFRNKEMPEIYVTCFCSDKDLLSQWRGYNHGEQAVCIVFDKSKLLAGIGWWTYNPFPTFAERKPDYLIPTLDSSTGNVIYCTPDKSHAAIASRLDGMWNSHRDAYGNVMNDEVLSDSLLINVFRLTVPYLKHSKFSEEGEYRLSILRVNNPEDIKFRSNGKKIIPYVEVRVKDALLPIKEVVIGPGPDSEVAHKGIAMFLTAHGYTDVNIVHSDIPYRG